MATVTHAVTTASTANTPSTSGAFTPALNDLLIVFVQIAAHNTLDDGVLSNSAGLTFTKFAQPRYTSTTHSLYGFVADALVSSATSQTVTITPTADAGTGTVISVFLVAGVTRAGLNAILQSASQSNQAASTTPAPVFAASALTGNPTLGAVANETNPATLTEPTGWTEAADVGYATPDKGLETVFRNSGFTGTTITWGGTSASAFASLIAEIDTSSVAPVITDVDTDESISATQLNVVATGTNFGATQGNSYLALVDKSGLSPESEIVLNQSIDSWSATSIQFDASIGTNPGVRYGSSFVRVGVPSGSPQVFSTDEIVVTITAPSGGSPQTLDKNYVNLTTLADPADRLTTSPDMEAGDQLEWSNVIGGTIADVTVYVDGSFSFVDGVTSFDFRVHNVTEGWGAIATQSTAGLVPTITTTTLPNGTVGVTYDNAVAATGDNPITYSVTVGSLPSGLSLGSEDGLISGVPSGRATASFTVQATNSFGSDTQALTLDIHPNIIPVMHSIGRGIGPGSGAGLGGVLH